MIGRIPTMAEPTPIPVIAFSEIGMSCTAHVVKEGSDLTIVANSHMTLEAYRALEMIDASVELIDLRTVKPLDKETILHIKMVL